ISEQSRGSGPGRGARARIRRHPSRPFQQLISYRVPVLVLGLGFVDIVLAGMRVEDRGGCKDRGTVGRRSDDREGEAVFSGPAAIICYPEQNIVSAKVRISGRPGEHRFARGEYWS